MLARIYHNPQNKDANQARLQKILQFWASKEVYDSETIYSLEGDMLAGPPAPAGSVKDSSVQEPSSGPSGSSYTFDSMNLFLFAFPLIYKL